MRVWLLLSLNLLWLTGCGLVAAPPPAPAYYELRLLTTEGEPWATAVAAREAGPRVEVQAPSWLRSRTMQYRLAYRDDLRRREYRESRWVAEPGEMITRSLERYLSFAPELAAGSRPMVLDARHRERRPALPATCRVRLTLDEFIQVFREAHDSYTLLEVRAELPGAVGRRIGPRWFTIRQPAASPDAFGGVDAHRRGLQQLADELRAWLESPEVQEALAGGADSCS
ncbi:ABC-type transport auxiliary lipoprotein family protein [Desulfurivibrio dismutans]|uniref:ABC-type transport auxiliary lipoprotein family protein n=1 Tax=Desulfurivibrio dismutans TaxID=1398908 RepID=UPI0023DCC46B|nr:ABC-type transport auxiliary lipoprotein family protein [Desulfurivibrio alkaliphilus]MDF1613406.1 ABC-type transport auxiliary lipoprotein family protein [Desulfurivibrio alkaliphilus]